MAFEKKFTDGQGNIFTVDQVVETPVGLTVYYADQRTGEKYSCLLEAFSERFKEQIQ